MDSSDYYNAGKPSPRREVQLQGPRPAPLKVRKDSYKIKKPPAGPSQSHPPPPAQQQQQQQQPRVPVIIYTVSPKVIHTEASNFMTLVQRLTGASPRTLSAAAAANAASSSVANHPSCPSPSAAGDLSPAARFAAIERAQASSDGNRAVISGTDDIVEQLGMAGNAVLDRSGSFPGILSPLPSALPPISANFFSPPPVDPTSLAFLNEMSPIVRGHGGGIMDAPYQPSPGNFGVPFQPSPGNFGVPFLPSPGNFLSTPTLPSPGALYWEFFNQL